jgi:Domain of unknown function (DUF4136)
MSLKLLNIGAFALAGMLALTSCANTAHIEKSKGAHLAAYKTYNWVEEEKQTTGNKKENRRKEIAQQNIQDAVNKQLQKSGWKLAESNPDVLVSTDLVIEKNQKQISDPVYSQPYTRTYFNRYSRRFNTYYFPSQFMGYDRYAAPVKEGTVTVTLIDAKTDKAVWQGWATNELYDNQVSDRDINRNVKSIFKKFDAGN